MNKSLVYAAIFLLVAVIIIPTLIVAPFGGQNSQQQAEAEDQSKPASTEKDKSSGPAIAVSVYRSQSDKVQTIDFQDYVVGVVASEMPADFNIEALKAQALAARTYVVKHLLRGPKADLPKDAEVTDTKYYQVYKSHDDLKKEWGDDYDSKIAKIEQAVSETAGEIITYNGQPIESMFFSTSNGYTEDSEDYWSNKIPYLKSVKSPWDENSPKSFETTTIPVSTFEQDLGVNLEEESGSIGKVVKTTNGHRVGKIKIAGHAFTGRDVREKLGLRSTDFELKKKDGKIYAETQGFGHGVGMSQYGANGMAKQGKSYKDIVTYYYSDVDIEKINPTLKGKLAAKD